MKPSQGMDVNTHTQAVCIGAIWDKDRLYPFSHLKKYFSQVSILKITYSHIQIFFVFLIKKKPKMGIQGPNLYIFLWHPKSEFFKKRNSEILKFLKICMPKKMTPKSQAKNRTPFT